MSEEGVSEDKGVWRMFDLDAMPRVGVPLLLVHGGHLTGKRARFLCVAENIRDGGHPEPLFGPWVIGWDEHGRRPLIYLAAAWEWFDESASTEGQASP